ncbi:MAG: alanine racemase [Chloroflexi bacterium]|nr:alanine racemase [Chloroflexota bacterium]
MAEHTRRFGVALRPHAKTHKTVEIARQQLAAGAVGLTLAKLGEVEGMLAAAEAAGDPLPLDDVLLAFPIVGEQKLARLLDLAQRLRVSVSLDSADAARQIGETAHAHGQQIGILVEVDTGGRRCGTLPGEPTLALAREIAATPGLTFRGIMTHEGHAYAASPATLRAVSQEAGRVMVQLAETLRTDGLETPVVSVGSTPSGRHIAEVPGITEVRPGTYVFQDFNQVRLGVATEADCAASVHATVIARPAPDRAVVDAGTKAVAADRNMIVVEREGYGCVKGQPGWYFARASEEHGVLLRQDDGHSEDLRVGDRVELIPNHICPAANLYDRLTIQRGGVVQGSWAVAARGRSQ